MNMATRVLAVIAALSIAGALSAPFKRVSDPAELREIASAPVGGASMLAILGGYKSVIADFIWIRAYCAWEKKDSAECSASIDLACSLDPQMATFWTQGARMIAQDMPHWFLARLPKAQRDEASLNLFRRKQSLIAVALLDRGLKLNPDNLQMLIAKGQILISVEKFAEAEKVFAKAKTLSDEFYSRRIYASLAAKNGKFDAALKELEKMLSEAEADNPVRAALTDEIQRVNSLKKLSEK